MTKETNLIYLILKSNKANEVNKVDYLWGLLATEVVLCCLNVVLGKFFTLFLSETLTYQALYHERGEIVLF